jgi:chemotaxis protein MotB
MKQAYFMLLALLMVDATSCVPAKRLKSANARYVKLNNDYRSLQSQLSACRDSSRLFKVKNESLDEQLSSQKTYNDQMLNQLKDLSVITGSQAESIRKSLENISAKDAYIKDLQSAIAQKDSLNMRLVMNLKGAIGDLYDQDINIKVDKGVVYIDISDRLLFKSGSYDVTEPAKVVLGKVAKVLLNQPDIEFMVEGHTDTVPYLRGVLLDNWDLSVKRATSVIRILQYQYNIPPARMTAAGRGEYVPLTTNETAEGRAKNRRTRIVILPQLDQFFKLLEEPAD